MCKCTTQMPGQSMKIDGSRDWKGWEYGQKQGIPPLRYSLNTDLGWSQHVTYKLHNQALPNIVRTERSPEVWFDGKCDVGSNEGLEKNREWLDHFGLLPDFIIFQWGETSLVLLDIFATLLLKLLTAWSRSSNFSWSLSDVSRTNLLITLFLYNMTIFASYLNAKILIVQHFKQMMKPKLAVEIRILVVLLLTKSCYI